MTPKSSIPTSSDKRLFTPGPLTTSATVKQAMLRDLGSRDLQFIEIVRDIRRRLVQLGEADEAQYTAIPMQGSGTFGIESVISSVIPADGKLLLVINGAYGRRIAQMASVLDIPCAEIIYDEDQPPVPAEVAAKLAEDAQITHVATIHCETTTGILNPIEEIGVLVHQAGRCYIVDAMSSFGAVPLNIPDAHIDYLVSSANKCVEGVPGFAFAVARKDALLATEGYSRTLSLDLLAQWRGLEANGQFRFTPPTHALLAFHQALIELEAEGGVDGRSARYQANHDVLMVGLKELGLIPYLCSEHQGPVITTIHYPEHPNFQFEDFYRRLSERGYIIYPGKLTHADCFRIGTIGRIFPRDVQDLVAAIREVFVAMGVTLDCT